MARKRRVKRGVFPVRRAAVRKRKRQAMFGGMGKLIAAGGYGAVRSRITSFVAPFAAKIPLGGISDEVGTMAALWAAKKFIGRKVPFVSQLANAGMMIEAAQIGQAIATGGLNLSNNSGSANNSTFTGGL